MYFNENGRFNTNLINSPAIKKSRNYFALEENIKNNINLDIIYKNYENNFILTKNISLDIFKKKIKDLYNQISLDEKIKNLLKGHSFPYILPIMNDSDIGENMQNIYLPALKKSFKSKFPNYDFINHINYNLNNEVLIRDGSRYKEYLANKPEQEKIGILFPCLNEFSFQASIEAINLLPKNFNLCGAYEVISCLIGMPEILYKKDKYPPLLWFSSLHKKNEDRTSFHIEPYGYNLTLNERSHLNLSAEYWWHSICLS